MFPIDFPCLRPGLRASLDRHDPDHVMVWDERRISSAQVRLSRQEYAWIELFDGASSLREIQDVAMRRLGGRLLPIELFTALTLKLEAALFLDTPRYRERLAGSIREPGHIGCYEGDPDRLRRQLHRFFTFPGGPGLPNLAHQGSGDGGGCLRAMLIPHIDYHRGGISYAWAFKELGDRTDAALFVIIGTSHYTRERFTLTRKHFKTPLGVVQTDQQYIDRLVAAYGDGLFTDEAAHLPEHSIELEVIFLQYLYEGRRHFRIVPLVVGAFDDCVSHQTAPAQQEDIGRMIEALRRVEGATREPICYIISGDLAHIGPKFGDPRPVHPQQLAHSRQQDQSLIRQAEAADMAGYFQIIAQEKDERRICGLPPTCTVLEAVRPSHGKLLHYDQYVHPDGYESVSFASMAFYS